MTTKKMLRVAVDIGGTFSDTVLVDADNRVLATTKTPTTPDNPTTGALEGVRRVLAQANRSIADVAGFIHGTTLATNALIERRGARVAAVTTEGFRDILEIAYERRYSQYDINLEKPDLIVPRRRCFTIPERVLANGEVHAPLDEAAVDDLVVSLDEAGVEAVAICFLHSYANPVHEQRLRDLLHQERPDLTISLSSEVSPEAREFERLCSTVANAYVQPLMSSYLQELASTFAAEGLTCPILMMTSGGGMTTDETALRYPIRLVESGPAGGAILAALVAAQRGEDSVLSFDMGGTTAKLCLIDDYQPQTSRTFEISRTERFIRGSGMPVRIPVIEMIEIGAGGGSIAEVDRLGRLTVGPKSAGSEPGPAAFGKGGTEATVTDADVGHHAPDGWLWLAGVPARNGRLCRGYDAGRRHTGRLDKNGGAAMTSPTRGFARIGVLVPFTNVNLEPDMELLRPAGVSVHFARLGGYAVDEIPDADQMAGLGAAPLGESLELLAGAKPDVILYGCTSATLTHGTEFDRSLAKQIHGLTSAKTVTAAGALVFALKTLNVSRIGFASPYTADINEDAIRFLADSGFATVSRAEVAEALGNYGQGELTPDEVFDLGQRADSSEAEAIVLSCTDMRSVETIAPLEEALGKPVITSNQAMMFETMVHLNLLTQAQPFGVLFRSKAPSPSPGANA